MRGTPTTLIFDRSGRLRVREFGHLDDLRLGAVIAALIAEKKSAAEGEVVMPAEASGERCPAGGACG